MSLELGQPNLVTFSQTLMDLARRDPDLLVVTSDSRGSGKLLPFAQTYPDQIIEVGIAEQNLVGISAGLASSGKNVFAVSPSCFLTARSLEQIKNDVCYSDNPVTLIGISAGVSYGALGTTHHSLHDLAVLRAIHNIDIIVPADNFETRGAIQAAYERAHPVFVRFGKRKMYDLPRKDPYFEIGKAMSIREGKDVVFIATGETVYPALAAALKLEEEQGLQCGVISMATIKPLDKAALREAARQYQAIITVEEHSVHGGLGEACAGVLIQENLSLPFSIVGIPDEYTVTGSQLEIFGHYGISEDGLAERARKIWNTTTNGTK